MALRTNYKDDVFTGKRKYRMTTNTDTTVSFDDETEYVQQGDTYGAAQLNEANSKINDLDSHAYRDSDAAETTMADNDYIPFYDASAGAKRRMTLSNIKSFLLGALAPKSHPSNSASTYGAGNASQFGHVKLSDNYTSSAGTANQSVGASSQAVHNAYANRAPVNHASADTTYGKGSSSAYGHVKVTDTYTSNPGAASEGVAASGKAVHDAYAAGQNNYNSLNNSKAPNNHKSSNTTYGVGNSSEYGHLKISDDITSVVGDASSGVAASNKAVIDVKAAAASDATAKANAAQSAAASDATTKANNAYTSANNNSVSRYNDIVGELTANGNRLYMDYKGGKYGYNTSANRGADTFHPFKQTLQFDYFQVITSGPLVISNALQYDNIIVVASQAGEIFASGDHVITINVEGGKLSNVHPNDDDCEAFYQKNRRAGVITPTANTVTITLSSTEAFNYPHIMAYCIIN